MTQFDVFENPIDRARRAYPFVVVLQSDLAETGRDRIVAPLVARSRMPATAGRLAPHVVLAEVAYVVLVPSLTTLRVDDLTEPRGQLIAYRDDLVAALDYLFLGV
jgi:toxin CcdB